MASYRSLDSLTRVVRMRTRIFRLQINVFFVFAYTFGNTAIYVIIAKNIRYLFRNRRAWRSLNNTYQTFLTVFGPPTIYVIPVCLTDVNSHFAKAIFATC